MESKEKEIEEMMLAVPQKIVAFDMNPKGQHLYGEQRKEIAEALYNAGYRKTFTSELASETQKAYKDGYEKGVHDEEEKRNRLLDKLYDSFDENSRLRNEIITKDELLQKHIDTDIATHKRHIKELESIAKRVLRKFVDFLKDYTTACKASGYDGIGEQDIEDKLKEFLNENS